MAMPSIPQLIDTAIKRFAQRYTYLGIDTIAAHDLGFAERARQVVPPVAIPPPPITNFAATPPTGPAGDRLPPRRSSPDPRGRRREPSPPPAKRFKPASPPPGPRRESRWDDRDRERERPPPPRRPSPPPAPARDREQDGIPSQLLWFIGTLPAASSFDGKE